MVWSRETEAERPPLSVILPRLYLGAENDVTQDQLASLGISYVLSVSRCSPQPSFLPRSRYLRIPIDDSLWDDLLPWIPQALHFIDAAMSSGASVLVHCAAGISRSPAMAVAYIMYSLEMNLDDAYRFVKERRPSISPNFNFLGQLQHFQGALSQRTPGSDFFMHQEDSVLPVIDGRVTSPWCSQTHSCEGGDRVAGDSRHKDSTPQTLSLSGGNQQHKLCTLDLSLCQNQRCSQKTCEAPVSSPCEPTKPAPRPTQLQLPSASASLLEKRKSLTLSLTPPGTCPPPPTSSSQLSRDTPTSKTISVHGRGTVERPQEGTRSRGRAHSRSGRCRTEVKESELKELGLLSPINVTLNKLLDWGERVLLGGLFAHPVRMGMPALPYKC